MQAEMTILRTSFERWKTIKGSRFVRRHRMSAEHCSVCSRLGRKKCECELVQIFLDESEQDLAEMM